MAKKRANVSLKTQLERAERKGHKKGMAELFALLSAADAGHKTEESNSYENQCQDYESRYFRARIDAALLNAVKEKQIELVFFLIKAGANVNIFNENDRTPLFIAVAEGNIDLVKALLKAGANPDLKDEKHRDTPLACAMEKGHTAIGMALLAAGADVPALRINYSAEGDQVEVTSAFLKAGAYIGPSGDEAWTPLMYSIDSGKMESAALLIEAGSDVNAHNDDGESVLMMALKVGKYGEDGDLDIIRLLLKAGAEVNYKDCYGYTALIRAAREGRSEAVRLLLSAGADVFSGYQSREMRMQNSPEDEWVTPDAFDVADDDAIKYILKTEMHRRIATALLVLPELPVDVRQKIIQLYVCDSGRDNMM